MSLINVKKGTMFLREGEPGSEAYFLDSGKMEVLKSIDGENVKIGEIPAGSIFGELCLIDRQKRSTSIVALANCSIHKISPNNIEAIINRDPKIAMAIIKTLTVRFRKTLELLDSKSWGSR